ncbi:MAG: site-specific integrase, partial [Lachnospiraceae bacterium]|nr:site-specific integrase [Lachnospiraceae bacterium]
LKLSNGDLKAVQGDGGWSTPDMVTKRYAHIVDEDRKKLAEVMESKFYQEEEEKDSGQSPELQAAIKMLLANPELLVKALGGLQSANNS